MTRVLLVDHTGSVSGAQHAALDMVRYLPGDIELTIASPPGEFQEMARAQGVSCAEIRGTDLSFRLHATQTVAGLARLAGSALELRRVAARYDLIHANSSRAGLIAAGARGLGGPPFLVHLHDAPAPGRLADALHAVLKGTAAGFLSISTYVTERTVGAAARPDLVFNPVDLERFTGSRGDRAVVRRALSLSDADEVVAVVGQITPWKAQDDAIRAIAILGERRPDARLLIIGSAKFLRPGTAYDNAGYERSLRRLADRLGATERVQFLGERRDLPSLLQAVDVLLVPSWSEPLGRVVLEGMAMGVPVVATAVGGPPEVIRMGDSGLLLAPRQPQLWAEEIAALLDDPVRARAIGARGRAEVERFDSRRYAEELAAIYRLAAAGELRRARALVS